MALDTEGVLEKFKGVISLLRFLRRCNRLSEIDKFASAPDADTAIDILRNAMSIIYRSRMEVEENGRKKPYCYEDEIKEEEKALYEFLCGKNCVKKIGGRYVVRVECPQLPADKELEELRKAIDKGGIKPSTLAAIALARVKRP